MEATNVKENKASGWQRKQWSVTEIKKAQENELQAEQLKKVRYTDDYKTSLCNIYFISKPNSSLNIIEAIITLK